MIRALAIVGAITSAWVSGVAANASKREPRFRKGMWWFFALAVVLGLIAWSI